MNEILRRYKRRDAQTRLHHAHLLRRRSSKNMEQQSESESSSSQSFNNIASRRASLPQSSEPGARCVLSASIPVSGFMPFTIWEMRLSDRCVALRCKLGVFLWSLGPHYFAADVRRRRKHQPPQFVNDVVPLVTCDTADAWPTVIAPDVEADRAANHFRAIAVDEQKVLLGDCFGLYVVAFAVCM